MCMPNALKWHNSIVLWAYGMFFYTVLTPIYTTSGLWSTGNMRKYQQIEVYIYQCVTGVTLLILWLTDRTNCSPTLSSPGGMARFIENTRWVSFDIKFTRRGFENACWYREACRAIQQAFSKPRLVNLISKDSNLVFYLSVYPIVEHFSN